MLIKPKAYLNYSLLCKLLLILGTNWTKKGDSTSSSLKSLLEESLESIKSLSEKVFGDEKQSENQVLEINDYNFTLFAQSRKQGNLSYVGFHLSIFDNDKQCRLETIGSRARVLWLWQTSR